MLGFLRRLGWLVVFGLGIGFWVFAFSYQGDQHAHKNERSKSAINNDFPAFAEIGGWADANHDSILALSAVGSFLFAGALVVFTWVLARRTGDLHKETAALRAIADEQRIDMLRSIKAAEKSAKATKKAAVAAVESAKISERALTDLEAPFLAIHIGDPGINRVVRDITFSDLKFTIINYGRTPAHILELSETVEGIAKAQNPPSLSPNKIRGAPMPYGVIAPPNGQSQEFRTVTNINFFENGRTFGDIIQRAWFRGFVRYRDIFQNHFILGFCFVFDDKSGRWILRGGKEHNYCKKDDADFPDWLHPSADKDSVRSSVNRAVLSFGGRQSES